MSSFGEELKRERELRQITLREISEATKISLRYLDALERNDFTHLPGGVFNKGFVRAYAQFIGVDQDAMVNAYLLEERDQAASIRPVETPVAAAPRRDRTASRVRVRSPAWRILSVLLILLVAAMLAGLLVLWFRRSRNAGPVSARPGINSLVPAADRLEGEA